MTFDAVMSNLPRLPNGAILLRQFDEGCEEIEDQVFRRLFESSYDPDAPSASLAKRAQELGGNWPEFIARWASEGCFG